MTQPTDTSETDIVAQPSLRSGVKTSEFWATLITLLLFVVGAFVPDDVAHRWGAEHGWIGGIVVAVYIAARAYVKSSALKVY